MHSGFESMSAEHLEEEAHSCTLMLLKKKHLLNAFLARQHNLINFSKAQLKVNQYNIFVRKINSPVLIMNKVVQTCTSDLHSFSSFATSMYTDSKIYTNSEIK